MTVEQAKQTLKENGYYTDNLWHVEDVKIEYDCDNDTAYEILDSVFNNGFLTETIFDIVDDVAFDEYELEKL